MLDPHKLQQLKKQKYLSEEEMLAEKRRLAVKILRKTERVPTKNGVIYILLAFFFGTIGLHNFYAGYWGRGLSQLCLTIISPWFLFIPLLVTAVWALIELLFVGKTAKNQQFSGNIKFRLMLKILVILVLGVSFYMTPTIVEYNISSNEVLDM